MPATGDVSTASATPFLQRCDLRVDHGDARPRRGNLLSPRAGLHAAERLGGRARAVARRRHPRDRHVAPRDAHRRAACASRRSTASSASKR